MRRFARNLRQARAARGWTSAELAERIGVSRPYMSQLEHALREPSIVTVVKLAKALKVSASDLLE